jgi:hypothetical protein
MYLWLAGNGIHRPEPDAEFADLVHIAESRLGGAGKSGDGPEVIFIKVFPVVQHIQTARVQPEDKFAAGPAIFRRIGILRILNDLIQEAVRVSIQLRKYLGMAVPLGLVGLDRFTASPYMFLQGYGHGVAAKLKNTMRRQASLQAAGVKY